MARVMTMLGVLLAVAFGQTVRWVYRYNGPGSGSDEGWSLAAGPDGSICAAGNSTGIGTGSDFTVIGLTAAGTERWVRRYNGTANDHDCANSVAVDADGNVYAAGSIADSASGSDFVVVSLTSTGTERWVYRYNLSGSEDDGANSVTVGPDGNIYAAGGGDDLSTVISLTSTGTERWVYHRGYGGSSAFSVVAARDGSIYAAGRDYSRSFDMMVIGLTSMGAERWVYEYDGPEGLNEEAYSLDVGSDGNLYVAGYRNDAGGWENSFIVLSLTSSGTYRWLYRYDNPGNPDDHAFSVDVGVDGNVYAAGGCYGSTEYDLLVVSLDALGTQRWVYRYDGPDSSWDSANSLAVGLDGHIYAAGYSEAGTEGWDFTVVSLTSTGSWRWLYRYPSPANQFASAYSLILGSDGNVYASGYSQGSETGDDFTVISLSPDAGVAEEAAITNESRSSLAVGSFRNRHITFTLRLTKPTAVSISLCDLQGRRLASWQVLAPAGTSQHTRSIPDLSTGIYFLNAEVLGKGLGENRKLIVVQ